MGVESILTFMLVFARVTSFLFFVPFLRGSYIPSTAKVSIGMGIAFFGYDMMPNVEADNMYQVISLILINVVIGIVLAYFVDILFQAIQMAGSLMDFDMGLSMAEVVDPAGGGRKTVVAGLYQTIFVIIFVLVGGIQALMMNVMFTFKLTDPDFFILKGEFLEMLLAMIAFMFAATIQIALPFMASIFIINFIFLIIGRASPQMNIFANMFVMKIMVGLIFLVLMIPFLSELMVSYSQVINEKMQEAITMIYAE